MLYSLLRSPKVRQVGQISLHVSVNGTAPTPEANGPDKAFVASVTDKGTGYYRITFKEPAKMNLIVSSIVTSTDAIICKAHLVDKDWVEIKTFNTSGVATDADIIVQVQFFDQLSYFF